MESRPCEASFQDPSTVDLTEKVFFDKLPSTASLHIALWQQNVQNKDAPIPRGQTSLMNLEELLVTKELNSQQQIVNNCYYLNPPTAPNCKPNPQDLGVLEFTFNYSNQANPHGVKPISVEVHTLPM
jgi:hypothetical protein